MRSPAATVEDQLNPSSKPYWRSVDIGLHLGYRKGLRGGRWVLRRYRGDGVYAVETFATADDNQEADGHEILSFYQAQKKVRELAKQYRTHGPGAEALTVKDAVEAYLKEKRGRDQHLRLARHVLKDEIADKPLASLTEAALDAWRGRRPKELTSATVRRISTDFRAALNAAGKAHRKSLPADFPAVVQHGLAVKEPTVAVSRAPQVLTDADVRRLTDAAWKVDAEDGWGGDLARLVLVLAATGTRFSQVVRMTVADVQANRLMIPVSMKGQGAKAAARIAVHAGDDVIAALKQRLRAGMGLRP